MSFRQIRIPKEDYDRARQLQAKIFREQQLRLPLWRCMTENNRKKVRDDLDLLSGVLRK